MPAKDQSGENLKPEPPKVNSILKYSGLAFQMIGILLVFTWLGRKGDQYFQFKTPWLTLVCILFALFGIMYKIIQDFSKK